MHHFFVRPDQIGKDTVRVEGQDAYHISNVLRMHPGEELTVCTGLDKRSYRCRIRSFVGDCVDVDILWVEEEGTELPSKICLFQGLPKGDKMEWIIQKAVELGASSIVPVAMSRCVVRLEGTKARKKVERWNAICENAARQSHRGIIPKVEEVTDFAGALRQAEKLDLLFIPYERCEGMKETREALALARPGTSIGIIIGPEGGLEGLEVEQAKACGAHPISLGRRILRTETAGMALIAALMLQLEPV